jgi:hypothetical protein
MPVQTPLASKGSRKRCLWCGLLLPEQWDAMRRAYLRGRTAAPIEERRLPFRLIEPLERVRERLEAA